MSNLEIQKQAKKNFLVITMFLVCIAGKAQKNKVFFVPASNTNIQYIGRFDFADKAKPVFMYSGCGLRTGFTGTSISVRLQDDSLRNWFTVKLDDSLFIFQSNKKEGIYKLGENLVNQKHVLEIFRRTEWHGGNTTFVGFGIEAGKKLISVKRPKKVFEFIGDSYTCGYGNEGKSREEHFSYATENNYLTFGAITSRAFNADYIGICRSGIRMSRGKQGDTSFTQPNKYDEVVVNSKALWDYKNNQSSIVVIDLGANDLKPDLDSTDFVNTYIQFVQKIRGQYGKANIICVAGPSAPGDNFMKFQSYVQSVTRHFMGKDKGIYYFQFSPFVPNGSDWHPNVKEHKQMASKLITFIKKYQLIK